jgi:hypothetical protein
MGIKPDLDELPDTICVVCGKAFRPKMVNGSVYCSNQCRKKGCKETVICQACGKPFEKYRSDKDARCCSRECWRKIAYEFMGHYHPDKFNEQIAVLYVQDLMTAEEIGQQIGMSRNAVRERLVKMGIPRRHGKQRYEGKETKFKYRTVTEGYVRIKLPASDPLHTMGDKQGWIAEHRVVMARYLGRPLEKWEIVHHKNHDRSDNRLENLELIQSKTVHHAETVMHESLLSLVAENESLKREVQLLKRQLAWYEAFAEVERVASPRRRAA